MPHTIEAICPCCGKSANSLDKLEELFGVRVPNGNKKSKILKYPYNLCNTNTTSDNYYTQ